ncbi:hypothetical protein DHEL01_v206472 [Diaporthe helianthi]|uniref:Alpha/beta hydrolase fold-3 domain-containing protein n=1 Tax=Diaporthe helianthi TaxID=158607 RepID=A0A2P5HY08_DIAHE|nr:hypothetical protein DHEL01_v206472 [Diaporthe helianthi]
MSLPVPYLDPLSLALADITSSEILANLTLPEYLAIFPVAQQHEKLPGVERSNFTVPIEGGVELWVYKSEEIIGDDLLPYIYFIHGGGWSVGSIEEYDSIVRDLALRTGFPVVFPEYTLAPEVQFPVQHEQCYDSLKWLTENGKTLGLQATNFAIAGDSAGGHLAAGLNTMAIEKRDFKIPFNVLISPITSTDTSKPLTQSEEELFGGPFISVPIIRGMADNYIPRAEDRVTPLGSPRFMPDELAAQFPPTLIVLSSADVLRTGGELLGEKLQGQGVDCAVVTGHGQLHDTVVSEAARDGPTPKALMTLIASDIKQRLSC